MPNPTISTITLPSGTTYDIADLAAREAASGINMVKVTQASDTPYGVTWNNGGTTVTGTLVASSSTTGKFYLVPITTQGGNDAYAEYITVLTGTSTYSWEKIGTTDIDLSNLGTLAYKNSASGSYTPAGTVSQPTFSGTTKKLAFSGTTKKLQFSGSSTSSTGTFTPSGAININDTSGAGTSYTPAGSIAVNDSSGSGTTYQPAGTVSQPTFTGATRYFKFSGTEGNVGVSGAVTGSASFTDPIAELSLAETEGTGSIGSVVTHVQLIDEVSGGKSVLTGGSININSTSGAGTSYTPAGSISVNAATGTGTSYTPAGTVSTPTISLKTAGSTTSVTPFGSAGTLPSLTMTVTDGNLAISFSQGTLPSAGTAVTVKTGDAAYESSQPTFSGTEKKLAFSGTAKKFEFSGTSTGLGINETDKYLTKASSSVVAGVTGTCTASGNFTPSGTISINNSTSTGATSYQPAGTVSQPTFTGTVKKLAFSGTAKKFAFSGAQGNVSVSGTPSGSITVNASSGQGTSYTPEGTIQVNASTGNGTEYTPAGTVSQPTFTGTAGTVSVS